MSYTNTYTGVAHAVTSNAGVAHAVTSNASYQNTVLTGGTSWGVNIKSSTEQYDDNPDWERLDKELGREKQLYLTSCVRTYHSLFHLENFLKTEKCYNFYWVKMPEINSVVENRQQTLRLAFDSIEEKSTFDKWFASYGGRFPDLRTFHTMVLPPPPENITDMYLVKIPKDTSLVTVTSWLLEKNLLDVCAFSDNLLGFSRKQDRAYFQMGFK